MSPVTVTCQHSTCIHLMTAPVVVKREKKEFKAGEYEHKVLYLVTATVEKARYTNKTNTRKNTSPLMSIRTQ